MTDWNSPAEIEKDTVAYVKFINAVSAIYMYEWLISLDFEWDFISGKKRFRWPMIFYFLNRYFLLLALIGIGLNCQALFTFFQLVGLAAVGLVSINLSIRTMAIWAQNRYIIGGLVLIILGHWSIILQGAPFPCKLDCHSDSELIALLIGVQLTTIYVPGEGCEILQSHSKVLPGIFIYSMCFDFTVLVLNTYKLLGINSDLMGRARLVQMIFIDGLIFFILAFLSNFVATVFLLLSLNPIMGIVFTAPAGVISTVSTSLSDYVPLTRPSTCQIVACRAVRRLSNFTHNGGEITYSSNNRPTTKRDERAISSLNFKSMPRSEIHVHMDTFTHAEDNQNSILPKVQEVSERDVEMNVESKGHSEWKHPIGSSRGRAF
ncbi:hypothetical protein M413DRAFT_423897 [Hebeloma cylindrosporum]|uniref:DUF6533 domain-containing protein n=1 Tax=Hebeloma cylindrosporum TaxID=76867 RepID=A0A0C3C047_HEBCY|nr:hypothetical protein M413DRAFT_423897 [Hebeloma cylindrosporum h7]